MPTYDYRCKDCSHEFEIQQSFSDDPLTVCPSCGGDLRKVFSAVGIAFKGEGFYKNDSRGSSSKASGTSTSSESSSEKVSEKSSGTETSTSEKKSSDTSSSTTSATPAPVA